MKGRKKLKRAARLQSASTWIKTYTGKNLVRGYQKWFGVDVRCAAVELRLLGIPVDDHYVDQVLKSRAANKEKKEACSETLFNSDHHFYYIVGYTSGGFAYGITWEEAEASGLSMVDCKEIGAFLL